MTTQRLRGITLSTLFPNPADPLRGLFVAEQVKATSDQVGWRVIAPVPFVPQVLTGVLGRPHAKGSRTTPEGILVVHPRYPVLPRRLLYTTVAPAVARASRHSFEVAVAALDPQFVHAHALYPSASAARRLASRAGLPLIVSIHGSDLYTNVAQPSWAAEVERTIASASALVCVSESLAHDAVTLAGADPARTLVIPDAYDDGRFRYGEREPLTERPVRLITVGRLVEVKGFDLLIDALASARASGLDATLDIVGEGPLRSALAGRAAARGVGDVVSFRGALAPDAIAEALLRADAYVLPSRKEGFGVALVEAMATGLPTIATDSGGPLDIVQAGQGVLVAPLDVDALASALSGVRDLVHASSGRVIAASIAARFSRTAVATRLVDLYREVTSGLQPTGTLSGPTQ